MCYVLTSDQRQGQHDSTGLYFFPSILCPCRSLGWKQKLRKETQRSIPNA